MAYHKDVRRVDTHTLARTDKINNITEPIKYKTIEQMYIQILCLEIEIQFKYFAHAYTNTSKMIKYKLYEHEDILKHPPQLHTTT